MKFSRNFKVYYNKITQSIAFYPAIIAVGFLLLSWGMLEIDFSPWGKQIKSGFSWISLKDASTARTIVSTVAGAIISLTVFSFSMVMIVLNQAASQMSNRVLSSMIENRFQQVILGFYIGTIVYALFLLSTIRDISSGIYVPALSIYLLIFLTVIDIFLFIYFLDYVTQTVKYETVIHRVQDQTMKSMEKHFIQKEDAKFSPSNKSYTALKAEESGYFQEINERKLMSLAEENNLMVQFLFAPSSFLLRGSSIARIYSQNIIEEKLCDNIMVEIDFYNGQPINVNPEYGFHQLAEVAIKALSPGINDPATAVLALHSLADLFSFRMYHHPSSLVQMDNKYSGIYIPHSSFTDLFEKCIYPIWHYGKEDQYIQNALLDMLEQLKGSDNKKLHSDLFDEMINKINKAKS
ncbi:MAG: DUF2254 domain-containing protein [Ginsengibacter sp.]